MYPALTWELTGGISRFNPIRLDLLARDTICAAEARGANAGTLKQTTQLAAINTDIRQIKILIQQADNAIAKALVDGDMTPKNPGTLANLLEQRRLSLTPASLSQALVSLNEACLMFN
tara:strand:+ start:112 stop:465 length:354 start_codon:yes stop_codon:yes gene_type:complete